MTKPKILRLDHHLSGQDAIWQCIREIGTFSLFDIEVLSSDDLQMDIVLNKTARNYIERLDKAGYVEALPREEGQHARKYWKLIKDTGIKAPRLDQDGLELPESDRQQLWRAMRIVKQFDAETLRANTDQSLKITLTNSKRYISYLHRAEYLQKIKSAKPNQLAIYQLLPHKNTGPEAPEVRQIKHIYDRNLKEIVWTQGEDV